MRGLGKSMVVFRLFEMKDQLNLRILTTIRSNLEEENGTIVALQISPKIESLYGLGRQATNL